MMMDLFVKLTASSVIYLRLKQRRHILNALSKPFSLLLSIQFCKEILGLSMFNGSVDVGGIKKYFLKGGLCYGQKLRHQKGVPLLAGKC